MEAEANAVFFCRVTGVRLVAPGVSKSVDPKDGVAEWGAPAGEAKETTAPAQPKGKKETSQ
jgi:hypothetical protein